MNQAQKASHVILWGTFWLQQKLGIHSNIGHPVELVHILWVNNELVFKDIKDSIQVLCQIVQTSKVLCLFFLHDLSP